MQYRSKINHLLAQLAGIKAIWSLIPFFPPAFNKAERLSIYHISVNPSSRRFFSWKNLKNISSSFRMQQLFWQIILLARPSRAYFREFYIYTLDFMIFFSARQSYNQQLLGNVLRIFSLCPNHISAREVTKLHVKENSVLWICFT